MAAYSDRYFEEYNATGQLGRPLVRGVTTTLTGQFGKFILQLASIVILARLLTPEDFGLVGMVAVVVNFLNMFKDFGLSQAIIQSERISRSQISTLFWTNVGLCCSISLAVLSLSPVVAIFYGREELVHVTMLFGVGIGAQSLGLQHRALLIRSMQFAKVEIVEIVSIFVSLSLAICLGLLGYGYWALVWQALSQALFLSAGYAIASRWMPGRFSNLRECMHLLKFGGGVFSFNCVNFLSRNCDNILIGKFVGAGPLGFYGRAYQLLMLPAKQVTTPVSKVALAALSRLQGSPPEFRSRYIQFLLLITLINLPIVIYLGFFTEIVIEVVFGSKWLGMVDVFRCLIPAALTAATNVAGSWVLIPLGRVSKQFYMGAVSSTVHLLAMLVGLRWGIIGVALSIGLSHTMMKLIMLSVAYRNTEIRLRDFIQVQSWPLFCALCAGVGASFILSLLDLAPLFSVLFSLGLFGSLYLLLILANSSIRGQLVQLKQYVRS
jgi:O-antigen/teichoic acid export membrane protein